MMFFFLAVFVNERGLHDIAVLRTQSANAVFSRADCISPPRGKRGVHSNNTEDCVDAEKNKQIAFGRTKQEMKAGDRKRAAYASAHNLCVLITVHCKTH